MKYIALQPTKFEEYCTWLKTNLKRELYFYKFGADMYGEFHATGITFTHEEDAIIFKLTFSLT